MPEQIADVKPTYVPVEHINLVLSEKVSNINQEDQELQKSIDELMEKVNSLKERQIEIRLNKSLLQLMAADILKGAGVIE